MNKKERLLSDSSDPGSVEKIAKGIETISHAASTAASFSREKSEQMYQKFDKTYGKLKDWAAHGHWTLQTICFIGGAANFVWSLLGLINVFKIVLSPLNYLLNVYIILFSFIVVVFEFPIELAIIQRIRKWFEVWVRVYDRLVGRGIAYILLGLLVAFANSFIAGIIFGVYMMLSGLICIFVGIVLSRRIHSMREQLQNSFGTEYARIKAQFDRFDTDNSGTIDASEFSRMCSSLGLHLNDQEREFALNMLDKNRDGVIDLHEFTAWYSSRTKQFV